MIFVKKSAVESERKYERKAAGENSLAPKVGHAVEVTLQLKTNRLLTDTTAAGCAERK